MKKLKTLTYLFLTLAFLCFSVPSKSQCPTGHKVEFSTDKSILISFDSVPLNVDSVFIDTKGNGVLDWVGTKTKYGTYLFYDESKIECTMYDITFGTPHSGFYNCSLHRFKPKVKDGVKVIRTK